jgi:hypothetical protein
VSAIIGKTHYRKVLKSDHLSLADLEDLVESGSDLIFTVSHVLQLLNEKVAGKKIDANIAYFKEAHMKPMVLNSINAKTIRKFAGGSPFVEDWNNLTIQLYIDRDVKFAGEKVGGFRIRPNAPKVSKPECRSMD